MPEIIVSETMIFHQFPDLQWLKKQSEENFILRKAYNGQALASAGWPSVVLNVQSSSIFRDNIRGPLSLFSNISGASVVHCEGKRKTVSSEYFFLTNADQRYTLEIEEGASAETINIHFGQQWAEEVLQSIRSKPESLLDHAAATTSTGFYNKLYRKDEAISALLSVLKESEGSILAEQEIMYEILVYLLRQNDQLRGREAQLGAIKSSTRQELAKRLHDATDYIYSNYQKDISLDDLARLSCLSKFHFLRLFKIAFGKSPLQFIHEVKVEHAKSLLKHSKLEVNVVARSLGFSSSSSFSRMFYNHVGVYPTQLR